MTHDDERRRNDEHRVGSDRVWVRGDRLIIESRVAMDGWEVRAYRRLLIRYAGRDYTPQRRRRTADGAMRYELIPWRPSPLEIPKGEVEYGVDYVERRDRAAASSARRARAGAVLNLLSPFVGLLSAKLKARIEERFAIDVTAATRLSVRIEALLVGPALAVVAIGLVARGLAGVDPGLPVRTCATIAILFGLDAMMRWDRLLAEERPPPGFFEWLWRRRVPRGPAADRGEDS